MTISYGNYAWYNKSPFKLTGYVSKTKYSTRDKALKVGGPSS